MKRVLLLVGVGGVFLIGAALWLIGPSSLGLTAEGRRARAMTRLERTGVVVRRSCYSMETFVAANRWAELNADGRRNAADMLAAFCAEQGSTGQMTILESGTRRKLAHWDGASFQEF